MTCRMRCLPILVCLALGLSRAHTEPLSSSDREALLDNLEKVRETANSKVDARFRLAMAAYTEALGSEDAIMELYLKCIGKLNFEDKKPSEFREWKHKEADKLKDPSFHEALRIQLRWLVLTLRSCSDKADMAAIGNEARSVLDELFGAAVRLQGQEQTLNQAVTSSVFARTYEIVLPDKAKLPSSPMQLDRVYSQVIFPPLHSPSQIEALRAAWNKRIQQEVIKFEAWSGRGGPGKGPPDPKSPEFEKFVTETVPELEWQKETDLFRNGDETGAAKRMLAHIEKHLDSHSARAWGDEFKNLLAPKTSAPAPAPAP